MLNKCRYRKICSKYQPTAATCANDYEATIKRHCGIAAKFFELEAIEDLTIYDQCVEDEKYCLSVQGKKKDSRPLQNNLGNGPRVFGRQTDRMRGLLSLIWFKLYAFFVFNFPRGLLLMICLSIAYLFFLLGIAAVDLSILLEYPDQEKPNMPQEVRQISKLSSLEISKTANYTISKYIKEPDFIKDGET